METQEKTEKYESPGNHSKDFPGYSHVTAFSCVFV